MKTVAPLQNTFHLIYKRDFIGKTAMIENVSRLKNEDGNIMALTLMMMVVLTIMAVSAINTTTIELQIAENDKTYKQNFYFAEAALVEAAKMIEEGSSDDLKPGTGAYVAWLMNDSVDMTNVNTMLANSAVSGVNASARYSATYSGIAGGGSLDLTQPTQLYEYEIYGLYYHVSRGTSHLMAGYRKRF